MLLFLFLIVSCMSVDCIVADDNSLVDFINKEFEFKLYIKTFVTLVQV